MRPYICLVALTVLSVGAEAKNGDVIDFSPVKDLTPCEQTRNFTFTKDGDGFQNPESVVSLLSQCLASFVNAPATYKALTLTMRAVAYEQQKDYSHAIEDREESLRLIPARTGWDCIGLATLYRKSGQPERALAVLRKMLQDNLGMSGKGTSPGMPSYYHLGLALLDLHQWRDAAEAFSEGMTYQPDYAWAYAYRALAYDRLKEAALARADLEKARLLVEQLTGSVRDGARQQLMNPPFLELIKRYRE